MLWELSLTYQRYRTVLEVLGGNDGEPLFSP